MKVHPLVDAARKCTVCTEHLDHPPRPVVAFSSRSRILIIGQAPGRKVHESGTPWMDASGKRLREWLGVSDSQFYDTRLFALMPMGFCFPGSGRSGDLPPRPECAPLWHPKMLAAMKHIKLTLLIGQYAQRHYLSGTHAGSLTENVRQFQDHLPQFLPLPHPSPRNRGWFTKNPWFETDLLPELKRRTFEAIASPD